MGSQLDPVEREPVCADLNRAILGESELYRRTVLSLVIPYSSNMPT